MLYLLICYFISSNVKTWTFYQRKFCVLLYFQMLKFFITLFLFAIIKCKDYLRLDTTESQHLQLAAGDSLISTLGYFKATLKQTGCYLQISMFEKQKLVYTKQGELRPDQFNSNCKILKIGEGRVETDDGIIYVDVQLQSHNYSTIFNIDDQGVVRLISTYISPNRVSHVSKETIFENFKIQPGFLRSFSQLQVKFFDSIPAVSNKRGWKFILETGQLTIYNADNHGMQTNYIYSEITIEFTKVFDFSQGQFPGILFGNISYAPRCLEPRKYLDFKPPFVFEIDPEWPIFRVYEQGRYKIFQITYPTISQFDYQQGIQEINYYHFFTPCPRMTFEYRGDCVASCPRPYYHEMRGQSGYCVLTCEQFSQVDHTKRICNCVTSFQYPKLDAKNINPCPKQAEQTPYGCKCPSGSYYDGILTFNCVQDCPQASFPSNGVCMRCPQKCSKCMKDGFFRRYLQCQQCEEGYKIYQGQCVKQCVTNHGFSLIEGVCQKCKDLNCVDCSNDPNVCLKCSTFTTLANGACNQTCEFPAQITYSEFFDTQCLSSDMTGGCVQFLTSHYKDKGFLKCDQCFMGFAHLNSCVEQCPAGYYPHNDKYCACSGVNNLTIYDECLGLPACPITMSFDIRSHSCLSCPYGCMSCLHTQCTSCNPGYYLFYSLQSVFCRRKSPLLPCDNFYEWKNSVCMVKQLEKPSLGLVLCRQNIQNCLACVPTNSDICLVCQQSYYIYNNTCLNQCPEYLIPYQNTCILPQIRNCSMPHLMSVRKYDLVTSQIRSKNKAYQHFIYQGKEAANDPVGYIPYYQEITVLKTDGMLRETVFFEPTWVCLKCTQGQGMASDLKNCIACPHPCLTCYYAQNNSCIKKIGDNNTDGQNGTIESQACFYDSQTSKCQQSCNNPDKFPELQNDKLVCESKAKAAVTDYLKIDSAVYSQKDGSKIIIFGFSEKIENIQSENLTSQNSEIELTLLKKNQTKVGQGQRDSQEDQTQTIIQLIENQYIFLDGQSSEAYILNLTKYLKKIRGSVTKSMLPNKAYGIYNDRNAQPLQTNSFFSRLLQQSQGSIFEYNTYQNHVMFIQTWLAYIGYIISIVIILLHAVFIGLQYQYKMDNLLIFCQTIFFFIYSKNFVGKLVSQYYYGWSWSHARFLPNIFNQVIVDHFSDNSPLAYRLVNLDGNFFRNAGFSLGWMLIFMGAWLVITAFIYLIHKARRAKEIWYPEVAKQSLFAGIQFFATNILFFSYSQLHYSSYPSNNNQQQIKFYEASQAVAITCIVVFSLYLIARWFMNPIAGLYMLKRLLIPAIIFASNEQLIFLLPMCGIEVLFVILRFIIEGPETKFEKGLIVGQGILFLIGYFLLYLCLDAGVNSIILSIIIFVFIVYLAFDLTILYLEFRQQYPYVTLEQQYQKEKGGKAKAIDQFEALKLSNKGSNLLQRQSSLFPGPTVF